jgi:hypothetical protein
VAERRRPKRDAKLDKQLAAALGRAGDDTEKADKARSWHSKATAAVPEVRGLRFCPGCKRCLNRDRNAAANICLQLKRLDLGLGPIKAMDKDEARLMEADAEVALNNCF